MSEIKYRPVDLRCHEVNGILRRGQTQIRRRVKLHGAPGTETDHSTWRFCEFYRGRAVFQHCTDIRRVITEACPHGKPGDRLFVRETWARCEPYPSNAHDTADKLGSPPLSLSPELVPYWRNRVMFRAGLPNDVKPCDIIERGSADKQWRSPIHMPRWASRLTLELTAVRLQRLQEISAADCFAEGIIQAAPEIPKDPQIEFAQVWESIHGPGSWAANDWVWAETFNVVQA